MRKLNIIILSLTFFVYGCISVSDIMGESEVESPETVDEVGQLLSDIQQEEDEIMDDLNESLEDQSLELSDEKLEASPTQEYDSMVLDQSEDNLTSDSVNNEVEAKPNDSFDQYQSTISKLSINDKIQYRVATINFYSGSSNVDITGLKKIKKIAKIAKERNAKIKIVGHASKRTRDMPLAKHKLVNFMISDKRAQSVANIFIKKYNFPSNSLITEAVSDTKPLFKENMPAGTQANQRTEIFLIY